MTPEAGGTVTLLVGAVLLRLAVGGTYRRYVQPAMGIWLTVAGTVLVVVGSVAVVRAVFGPAPADRGVGEHPASHDHAGHDHASHAHASDAHASDAHASDAHAHGGRGARISWLLLAPLLTLLLVSPPSLGAFALNRGGARVSTPRSSNWPPLVGGSVPFDLPVAEFYSRAFGGADALGPATVRLTGFVAGANADGFLLARYQIACCAADATAAIVRVVGYSGVAPGRDQWVTVVGTFGGIERGEPRLVATTATPTAAPVDPYE